MHFSLGTDVVLDVTQILVLDVTQIVALGITLVAALSLVLDSRERFILANLAAKPTKSGFQQANVTASYREKKAIRCQADWALLFASLRSAS